MTVDTSKTYTIIAIYYAATAPAIAYGVYLLSNGVITERHVGYTSPSLSTGTYFKPSISGDTLTLGEGFNSRNPCYSYVFEGNLE